MSVKAMAKKVDKLYMKFRFSIEIFLYYLFAKQ